MFHRRSILKAHRLTIMKAQGKGAQDALDRLNAFLNASEPELVRLLTRFWGDQQQAITYKELRDAFLRGYLDEQTFSTWQEDYARFVIEKLKPSWVSAMNISTARLAAEHPDFFFDPMSKGVQNWITQHGAEWVTQISGQQREAISAMLSHAVSEGWSADELARAIRPVIGLTKQQSTANLKYYQHIKSSLLENNPDIKEATAEKRAREAAFKYAEKQHRQRAYSIATSELAFAYNKGQDEAIKQAMREGYVGRMVKVWSTAADSGVCDICAALEGVEVEVGDEFDFKGRNLYSGQKETPPAHPRCRCAVEYREVEPPAWKIAEGQRQATAETLQWEQEPYIISMEPILGKVGDTNGYTTITTVEPFNFGDTQSVQKRLNDFIEAYRTAKEEHALILSPQNVIFLLDGTSISVDTRLAGKDAIRGGFEIHNHPPQEDGFADSFSRDDFREFFWGEPAESWLVAGAHVYRMSYNGPPISPGEAVAKYKEAFRAVLQRAMETNMPVNDMEQLEIMRWLSEHMEGLSFDELS